jgi:type IV fimbrial biogenesis protein FimT
MKIQSGLTLIELMVALAAGIIILAIGVPSFMNLHSVNQMAGYSNDLVGALRLARSEAVKRADSVTVCASNDDQTGCQDDDWFNGWIVFADDDADGGFDAGEEILRVWSIKPDDRANLEIQAAAPNSIRFDATGANAANATTQFAFQKDDCVSNQARQITVTIMGRPSVATLDCF